MLAASAWKRVGSLLAPQRTVINASGAGRVVIAPFQADRRVVVLSAAIGFNAASTVDWQSIAGIAQVATVDIDGTTDGLFTVTIDGTAFTFTGSTSTATEIRDGLITDINTPPKDEPVTASVLDADSFLVTWDRAGVVGTITDGHASQASDIDSAITTAIATSLAGVKDFAAGTTEIDTPALIVSANGAGLDIVLGAAAHGFVLWTYD
jgi:hypothetical protein